MSQSDQRALSRAASLLQERYRGYRDERESAGLNLNKSNKRRKPAQDGEEDVAAMKPSDSTTMRGSDRWGVAMASQGHKELANQQMEGKNDATSRWKRTGHYAEMLAEAPSESAKSGDAASGSTPPSEKPMEARYWLEMVDQKHRYGSNLKYYHARWNEEDTDQAFFLWLDEGAGKELDLPECSREKLERERIVYLNAEQRRNYMVDVKDGLLVWARNGRRVDTARRRHRDLGNGKGIIDIGGPEDDQPAESEASKGLDKVKDTLLRRSSKQNIWIYVMTAAKKLYVGMKQRGVFQHSSLAFGSHVLSAGELKVRDGKLTSLTALSGHYRTGSEHFENFISVLRKQGVNMHHVSIVKSRAVVRGMETYVKTKHKNQGLVKDVKEKLHIGKKASDEEDDDGSSSDASSISRSSEEADRLHMHDAQADAAREQDRPDEGAGLPHEGKDASQLSEQERYERGVALMRKAMTKGTRQETSGDAEDAQPGGDTDA